MMDNEILKIKYNPEDKKVLYITNYITKLLIWNISWRLSDEFHCVTCDRSLRAMIYNS